MDYFPRSIRDPNMETLREMADFLIYGATGYTGSLIAHEAVRRGYRPILAGRNAEALAALAKKLALEQRVFSLDDPAAVIAGLRGVGAVLNCAGPFAHTSTPMADGCLQACVHYLDITGEVDVFEALAARSKEVVARSGFGLYGLGWLRRFRRFNPPGNPLSMTLKSRLKKLEEAVGKAPCPVCRDWWNGPIVIRDETYPPAHHDPDVCPRCGRERPEGLILEIVIAEQTVPPRTFVEEF